MNNNQSFLGGLTQTNSGEPNTNNTNSVIPGAGLTPIGGPTGGSEPSTGNIASAPTSSVVAGPSPVVPISIMGGASEGVASASVPDSGGGNELLGPSIVNSNDTVVPTTNSTPTGQVTSNVSPSIVDANSVNNGSVSNNDVLGFELNSPVLSVNNNASNKLDLTANSTSPFDIGISSMSANTNILPSGSANIVDNVTDNRPFTNETSNTNIEGEEVVSVGTYIVNTILYSVPLIGFIVLLINAVSKKKNKNIRNHARANLILMFVMVALFTVLGIVMLMLAGQEA